MPILLAAPFFSSTGGWFGSSVTILGSSGSFYMSLVYLSADVDVVVLGLRTAFILNFLGRHLSQLDGFLHSYLPLEVRMSQVWEPLVGQPVAYHD